MMRAHVTIDDDLLERARELTGIKRTSDLANAALKALIEREDRKTPRKDGWE